MKVFIDSDVVISALISQKGAAYQLLCRKEIDFFISNYSVDEITNALKELKINKNQLNKIIIKGKFIIVKIKEDKLISYKKYINDIYDSHIVAGAEISKADFLITYNLRDYRAEEIKRDLKIIILTPGKFLQYLRST